jgi:acetyl esterase/lipase
VPVTDNTASIDSSWGPNADAPWLTPERMIWFKRNYLPNKEDWIKWDASPLFAPDALIAKTPRAWVGVAELDILREEGLAYAEKLKKNGVNVEVHVYKGAPHPFMAMDGKCRFFFTSSCKA